MEKDRSILYTAGYAPSPEDQEIVEDAVNPDGEEADDHRDEGFAAFPQGAGIDV